MADTKIAKKHINRFWSYVDLKVIGCWEWQGGLFPNGYGQYRIGEKKVKTHRVAYRLEVEKIPNGLCVLHHCDNPKCVRPDHLFLGTNKDNSLDRDRKGRTAKGPDQSKGSPGELNPSAKLTKVQVGKIRELHKLGVSYRELGQLFGVWSSQIGNIIRGECWT